MAKRSLRSAAVLSAAVTILAAGCAEGTVKGTVLGHGGADLDTRHPKSVLVITGKDGKEYHVEATSDDLNRCRAGDRYPDCLRKSR